MKTQKILEVNGGREKIPGAVDQIKKRLRAQKLPGQSVTQAILSAEEILVALMDNAQACGVEDTVSIFMSSFLGNTELHFIAAGDPVDLHESFMAPIAGMDDPEDAELLEIKDRLWRRLFGDHLQIKNTGKKNTVIFRVKKSPYAQLIYTVLALLAGVGAGILLKAAAGPEVSQMISENVFAPIYTVFMNALKMIVAPLVFCSIASSIADFSDIRSLGRIAARVVGFYLLTSFLAICVGLVTSMIFPIGDPSLASVVSVEAAQSTLSKGEGVTISIIDTLIGAVPTDIISPFQNSNMLQIIFMAVILGLTASAFARKYPALREGLIMMNAVFSKITSVLVSFIPLVVLCSMAKMMIGMEFSSLANVVVWIPVVYFGDVMMICVYMILLLVIGRLNPIRFLGKYYPAMISAFTLAASNPALPSSIKQCEELGVDKKVYSFSLPLGATINMDGSCISLMVSSLFMARIFGLPINGSVLMSLLIAIMVLSVGSPGVPGGNLVCLALLIPQIGVPAEAISLILGLYPVVGMM
ncbi:MAG: dicarboxylate/amino acid:cation symporter, partial [Lachnospiraceae bacterium]|nr:dicarboxylate/amino acid:cation symporter [Lachnospiraceae bacterium]